MSSCFYRVQVVIWDSVKSHFAYLALSHQFWSRPYFLLLSPFCSVLTVCSHHWKSVHHWLLLLRPYITLTSQPATGFDVPAAYSSPLFIIQTWQPSKVASWYEPLLPLHEPLVILAHYYSTLWLSSPPVGMHLMRCSLFDTSDVQAVFVYVATRHFVFNITQKVCLVRSHH